MRILLKDLQPSTDYSFQLRSLSSTGEASEWSRIFTITTDQDQDPPAPPTNLTVESVGDAFIGDWDAPVTSQDGTPLVDFKHFIVTVTSSLRPGKTRTFIVPESKFTLSFEQNVSTFGQPTGEVTFEVAAVDLTGNVSSSIQDSAVNPPPSPVTGLVAEEVSDGIALSWNPNTTDLDLKNYEIWLSTSGASGTYTKIAESGSSSYNHYSTLYNSDHWYRVYSVDKFNTKSAHTQTTQAVRPKSPFLVDSTAPGTPTGLAGTITTTVDRAALNISWTNGANPDNDLAGTVIGYRAVGSSDWSYTTVDYTLSSTRIENITPYVNYEIRARAYDWSANYSAWTNTVTTNTAATNTAPPTVTGVAITAGLDSVTVSWAESTADDVKNGAGVYLVQIATNNAFTTGLLEYRTGSTQISVTGLAQNQTYYARVKAVDSAGLQSASWSTVVNAGTGDFPAGSTFDYTISATEPSSPDVGDIWMDTSSGFEKQWNGSDWVNTGNASIDYVDGKTDNLVKNYVTEYAVNSSETVAPTTGWSTATPTRTPGTFIWYRVVVTYGDDTTSTTSPALLTGNTGATGSAGTPAPFIGLTATTQVLTSPATGGATTPTTSVVTGTATNTTITVWQYSVNGAAFSNTVPTGVSRTGNVVTITGSTMTAKTIAVRMADANGVADTLTVAKVLDGATGAPGDPGDPGLPGDPGDPGLPGDPGDPGADAFTVLLTNESHTFPGSTTAALAGSTTTNIIAYEGATLSNATIGTITGQVTGLTTSVTGSGTTNPTITITVTTSLTTKSGTLTIPVTVNGVTFTKRFSWSLALQGSQGIQGLPGDDGTTYYTWLKYADTPTTGMSDSPTGKTYMGIAVNKTSPTESTTYSDYTWSLIKGDQGIPGTPGDDGVTYYTWIKYGTSAAGAGLSDDPTGRPYIGIAYNKTTATESTNAADYTWSLIQGAPGSDGTDGVGITSVTPYFYRITTGSAAPAKPTASPPPSPWTATEPDYLANTELYRTERIIYTDASFAYTNVSKVSAYTAAVTAIASANGKNKVIHSTSAASGTTGYVAGDTWFRYDGSDNIIAQWRYSGSAWVPEQVGSDVIANLDAGKLTANSAFITTLNIGSGGVIQSAGYTSGGTSGFQLSNTGLTIKGTGNVVDVGAVSAGTINAKTWNVGAGGVINVDSTGQIKSNNYAANSTGYKLSNSGLEINDGSIDAKALRTGTAVIGDLTIGQSANTLGSIKSFGYVAGTTGWKLDKSGLEINNGDIAASALRLNSSPNLVPVQYADFEWDTFWYKSAFWSSGKGKDGIAESAIINGIVADPNTGKQSLGFSAFSSTAGWFALGLSNTDYNIALNDAGRYIFSFYAKNIASAADTWNVQIKGNNGNIIASQVIVLPANMTTFQRYSFAFDRPASGVVACVPIFNRTSTTHVTLVRFDSVQMELRTGNTDEPSIWKPPGTTMINGYGISTGEIRSTAYVSVNGTEYPSWSMNVQGNMQVGDAMTRGKMIVGLGQSIPQTRVVNDSFENTSLWQFPWPDDHVITSYSGAVRTGSLAVQAFISHDPLIANYLPEISTTSGRNFVMSCWASVDWSGHGQSNVLVGFVVQIKDALGNWKEYYRTTEATAHSVSSLSWNKVTQSVTVPASAVAVKFSIITIGSRLSLVYIDDFTVDASGFSDMDAGESYIASGNYVANSMGWKIDSLGTAEFNNAVVRGNVDSVTFTGSNFLSSGSIFAGDLNSNHTAITETGLSVYSVSPNEGMIESVRLGTYDDMLQMMDLGGEVTASINSGGEASFTKLNINEGPQNLELAGKPLSEYIEQETGGKVVALALRTTNGSSTTTTEAPYLEMSFDAKAGRTYLIQWMMAVNSNEGQGRMIVYLRYTTNGASPTTSSSIARSIRYQNPSSAGGDSWLSGSKIFSHTSDTSYRFLISYKAEGAGTIRGSASAGNPSELWITDLGPTVPDVGVDRSGGSVPPAKKTFTSTWTANLSECYNASGNPRNSTSDIVQGDIGTSNGNCHGMYLFTGTATSGETAKTISSALSGASINKVEVYLYATHWYYGSGGTAIIRPTNATSLNGNTPTGSYRSVSGWGRASGRWVDITSLATTSIRGVTVGKAPDSSYIYYGRFNPHNASSGKPQLRITYTR